MPWRGVWPKVAIPAVSSRIEAPGGGEHRAADFDPVRAAGKPDLAPQDGEVLDHWNRVPPVVFSNGGETFRLAQTVRLRDQNGDKQSCQHV